jgi:hypothetical protein
MNVSSTSTSIASASSQAQQGTVAEAAQLLVLKKAMNIEASSALALLQSVPGNLPLATSGNLGTKVNTTA